MIAGSVAALVSLVLARRVRAADLDPDNCYVAVASCNGGVGTHVKCSAVEGRRVGEVFPGKADSETENTCYEIASAKPQEKSAFSGEEVTTVGATYRKIDDILCNDGCDKCNKCVCMVGTYPDEVPAPKVDVTITWADSSQVSGISDPDGVPNSGDETVLYLGKVFTNGQTWALCPTHYYACGQWTFDWTSTIFGYHIYSYSRFQKWINRAGAQTMILDNHLHRQTLDGFGPFTSGAAEVTVTRLGDGFRGRKYFSESDTFQQTWRLSAENLDPNNFADDGQISDAQFGQMTTDEHLTIKWERNVDAPWGC